MERLMRVVIGKMRTSRQDLRRAVGMKSREQVALEEDKIAERTSAVVAGRKDERRGGGRRRKVRRRIRWGRRGKGRSKFENLITEEIQEGIGRSEDHTSELQSP